MNSESSYNKELLSGWHTYNADTKFMLNASDSCGMIGQIQRTITIQIHRKLIHNIRIYTNRI